MVKNISDKIDYYIEIYSNFKKAQVINERLIKISQGKAPIQKIKLKLSYLIKPYFFLIAISLIIVSAFFLFKTNIIEGRKILPVYQSINGYSADSDTLFIHNFLDSNLVLVLLVKDIEELYLDSLNLSNTTNDTFEYKYIGEVFTKSKLPFTLEKSNMPVSSRITGTPSYAGSIAINRGDYIFFISCFNPHDAAGFIQIETSNNLRASTKYFNRTSNYIYDVVKIHKSNILDSIQIRGFMKNIRGNLEVTSGTTWSSWTTIYK